MAQLEINMQLVSKFSYILFLIAGVLTLFSYLRFNWLLGSLANILNKKSYEFFELQNAYPLRAVAGNPGHDRAMRLLRDYAKSKYDMDLPENILSSLRNTNKWYKLSIFFAIQLILTFIIAGVANT